MNEDYFVVCGPAGKQNDCCQQQPKQIGSLGMYADPLQFTLQPHYEDNKCQHAASVQCGRVTTTGKQSETLEDYESMYDDLFELSDLEPNNVFISKDESESSNHELSSFTRTNNNLNEQTTICTQSVIEPDPSMAYCALMFRAFQNSNNKCNPEPKLQASSSRNYRNPTTMALVQDVTVFEGSLSSHCIERSCETPFAEVDCSVQYNLEPNHVLFEAFTTGVQSFHSSAAASPCSQTLPLPLSPRQATTRNSEDNVLKRKEYSSNEEQKEKKRKNISPEPSYNFGGKKLRRNDMSPCLVVVPSHISPELNACLVTSHCKGNKSSAEHKTSLLKWTKDFKLNTREKFPQKLYRLLEETEANGLSHVISFTDRGDSFRVHDKSAFVERIVPRYFRHQTFNSFQRQLNYYGFERVHVGANTGTYVHPFFKRGSPGQCSAIRRVIDGKER